MKKFQSFDDVSDYLCTEEVPFEDRKLEILKSIKVKSNIQKVIPNKLSIVLVSLLILLTCVACTYGVIKLLDDRGNTVVQIGVLDKQDKIIDHLDKRRIEATKEIRYYSLDEVKEHIPDNSPLPGYIPGGYEFNYSVINPNKSQPAYWLNYLNKNISNNEQKVTVITSLQLHITKGQLSVSVNKELPEIDTVIVEHNGKEYIKQIDGDNSLYYTYLYIDNELWTIIIATSLSDDEVFKIVEELEY